MENQHRKIAGYRELIKEEIDLMNRIKAKGQELLALHAELEGRLSTDLEVKLAAARKSVENAGDEWFKVSEHNGATEECIEYRRFVAAEPQRWSAIAKTDIQTGIMALVRAIAQPSMG